MNLAFKITFFCVLLLVSCSKKKEETPTNKIESLLEKNAVQNSKTGRIWMDRDLGRKKIPLSYDEKTDLISLYQWGRPADGHEQRNSTTVEYPLSASEITDGKFILASLNWSKNGNDDYWNGVSGKNNPCPEGFRVPTMAEWKEEMNSWGETTISGSFFNSPLKLNFTGYRDNRTGQIKDTFSGAYYWATDNSTDDAQCLFIKNDEAYLTQAIKSYGFAIRCIYDE